MAKKISLIKNIFLSNFKRLTSPYRVLFALTYKCNLRCKICRIWERPHKEELSAQNIEKIFKSLHNLNWLDLSGGEPTLKDDLIEIAKVIIKNSKNLSFFHISTNGQMPDKVFSLAKEVIKSNITFMANVSLDGPEDINDQLKGVKGAYANSIETFKLLKGLNKGQIYLSCTLSDYNIGHIDRLLLELKRDLPRFSLSDLHFNIFHTSSHYYKNQFMNGTSNLDFEKLKQYLTLSKNGNFIKKFIEGRYLRLLCTYSKGDKFPLRCHALRSSCFINPYGEVFPCLVFDRKIGNLAEHDYNLDKLWSGQIAHEAMREIEDKACPECWMSCETYAAILGNLFSFTHKEKGATPARRNVFGDALRRAGTAIKPRGSTGR